MNSARVISTRSVNGLHTACTMLLPQRRMPGAVHHLNDFMEIFLSDLLVQSNKGNAVIDALCEFGNGLFPCPLISNYSKVNDPLF